MWCRRRMEKMLNGHGHGDKRESSESGGEEMNPAGKQIIIWEQVEREFNCQNT